MRRVGVAAALVFLFAPAAQARVIFGINDGNLQTLWAQMAPRLRPLGNVQVGVWVRWRCSTDTNNWLVAGMPSDLGQIPTSQPVLLQLIGSPSCTPKTRRQRRSYARRALRLARRYPQIRELQVWNEPDLAFWQGTPMDYVKLLAATHDALRGKHVKVLGPGFSPHVTEGRTEGFTLGAFTSAVYDLYLLQPHRRGSIFDGFAYHPYWGWENAATMQIVRGLNEGLRGTPQRSPRRGLRLWWTETGAESTVNDAPRDEFGNGYYGVSNGWPAQLGMMGDAEFQARKVCAVARAARRNRFVVADFNFQLGDDGNLSRWQSGLYYVDGKPKPAFYSFVSAISAPGR